MTNFGSLGAFSDAVGRKERESIDYMFVGYGVDSHDITNNDAAYSSMTIRAGQPIYRIIDSDAKSKRNRQNGNHAKKDECEQMLKDYGIWDKVSEILKNPPLVDVEEVFNELVQNNGDGDFSSPPMTDDPVQDASVRAAGFYFGSLAKSGQGLLETFDKITQRPGNAVTVNPAVTPFFQNPPAVSAIYFRGSQSNIRTNRNLLLHEIVHLVLPSVFSEQSKRKFTNLDKIVIQEFEIDKRAGESDSDAVSRFFNGGCRTSERFGNSQR